MTTPVRSLEHAWREIHARIGAATELEPFESAAAVDRHREYWRPEAVKVVLLAESHVYTPSAEQSCTVDLTPFDLGSAPRDFVRFVYCLGYGENSLVSGRVEGNVGTWQYWKLLATCVAHGHPTLQVDGVLKGFESDPVRRIHNKIAVLHEMRRRGIWLVDASITALYAPGGKKPAPALMAGAVLTSWTTHWRNQLSAAAPAHVVCVGKSVHAWIQTELRAVFSDRITVISQPNAHISRAVRGKEMEVLRHVCRRYAPP
jgi:hypothetical protein